MTTAKNLGKWLSAALLATLLTAANAGAAAVITIVNNDGAGEGFNDPALRAPVGGNPATTLGGQRLFIFQHAAGIWGGILTSNVQILVRAQFDPQTCSATSAVLGSAGPVTIHRDFSNAPFPGTWYHAALANRLSGLDLSPANPDINATFNSNIDNGCFGPGLVWYYGIDGNEGANIELLPVVLHEIGHGLGSSTTTNGQTGLFNGGFPAIWDRFLMDNTTGRHWFEMTEAERAASAVSGDHLVWDGPAAMSEAGSYLGLRARLLVNSPPGLAGDKAAQAASFGAPLTQAGVTGDVVAADDGMGMDPFDICEPLVNGPALAGKIALVNRGTCTFAFKAAAVQAAGAIGLIVANNTTGLPPMGGSDPTITIPCIGITQADGAAIRAALPTGVNATIGLHPTLKAGMDAAGHPLMYAPNMFAGGSSVSHWDVTMMPNALMEPALNADLHDTVDITHGQFVDIGWFPQTVPVALAEFAAEGNDDGILVRWRFEDLTEVATITLERATSENGPWVPTRTELGQEGGVTTALDTSAEPGVTYWYHLRITDRTGEAAAIGLASAQRTIESMRLAVSPPNPNPALHGTSVQFRIGTKQRVKLTICDVKGRTVRRLQDGTMPAGQHEEHWDGRTDQGTQAPSGVYFIRLDAAAGTRTLRVTLLR